MTAVWACAHQQGQPTYHNTERAAESAARELVAAHKTTIAVVYRIDIHDQGEQ